jgi:hypothetical protein
MTEITSSLSSRIESEPTGVKNVEDGQVGHDSAVGKESSIGEKTVDTKSNKAPRQSHVLQNVFSSSLIHQ